MLLNLGRYMSAKAVSLGGSSAALLPNSTALYIDATNADSYSGSGTTISNLIASPADGAAQTDYDFIFRNSASFVGTAGDTDAYFYFTGRTGTEDYIETIVEDVSGQPAVRDWAKTSSGNKWWVAIAFYLQDDDQNRTIFQARNGAGTAGMGMECNFVEGYDMAYNNGSVSNKTWPDVYTHLFHDTPMLLIVSGDIDSAKMRFWLNNRTMDEVDYVFTEFTDDASSNLKIGGDPGNSKYFQGRLYAFALGYQEFLDNDGAGAIFDAWEAQHQRIYAS